MKIKTSELTGFALRWVVAKCVEKEDATQIRWDSDGDPLGPIYDANCGGYPVYEPDEDWAQGGPIIEREGITLIRRILHDGTPDWWATTEVSDLRADYDPIGLSAPTPLTAAMRCFVASKLGDEVEVPEELL